MGIHGLSTFIQRYHDRHKEKIYLKHCPVVIDGCNLMFFLYFDWRQGSGISGPSGSPITKTSPLKNPYLFGGDYGFYAQTVREFFQHLKHCGITPIVLFDGAYDALKIRTAFKRFEENLKNNVRGGGTSLKGIVPGSSYSPVFMKAVFVEVLQEQKILHYQTENEADCTIAFVARKLGNCPILSSDSDFHIYLNAVVLPLHTLRFKKVAPKGRKGEGTPGGSTEKIWTLHSEFVSLRKLCKVEFNLQDERLLPLAAVILGNDWIRSSTFSKFLAGGGAKTKRTIRIASLLRWLGKQRSYNGVLKMMISTVKEEEREKVFELVKEIVETYQGLRGEEAVWKRIVESGLVDEFVTQEHEDEAETTIQNMLDNLSLQEHNDPLNGINFEADLDDSNVDDEEGEDSDAEDIEEMPCGSQENNKKLPDWYLSSHMSCKFPTYLLKIARNKVVFLSPQVEVNFLPSTHSMSTPIIRVIGGLLLRKDEHLTLVTRSKAALYKTQVDTISELPKLGELPRITESSPDIKECFTLEQRAQVIYETLGLFSPEFVAFVDKWPATLRIWIISLVYFIKTLTSPDEGEDCNQENLADKTVTPVAVAILFSVMKNLVTNPSGPGSRQSLGTSQEGENTSARIADIVSASCDSEAVSKLRLFYLKYEKLGDTVSRGFLKSYDISRAYNVSRFTALLFHLHQLNLLLGEPFRPPRLNSNLNTWFVYNLSGELCENGESDSLDSVLSSVQDLCALKPLSDIVRQVLQFGRDDA